MTFQIIHNPAEIAEISTRFNLRSANAAALAAVMKRLSETVDRKTGTSYPELVADLATGVGKTYLMSSLVDALSAQGVRHFLVVTPGSTIQRKTLQNFDAASTKYVSGSDMAPFVVTPDNFDRASTADALRDPNVVKVFVFNVQLLIDPGTNTSRKIRESNEYLGQSLYDAILALEDLVVISDEHHVYHQNAVVFSAAIRDLHPLALVGLTATPNESDVPNIVFTYSLARAIADELVKLPVVAYRPDGTSDERTQLRDACMLRERKQAAYEQYLALHTEKTPVNPVLFVVCQSRDEAEQVAQLLAGEGFIGDPDAILLIIGGSTDAALQALADVEDANSPIRAIVSVNVLREGWDVRNVAVIVALRKLASQALTEQILGRGLRLPFGERTGVPMVDTVDLVAHDSYKQLLAQKDILRGRLMRPSAAPVRVDEQGAAVLPADVDVSEDVELPADTEWNPSDFLSIPSTALSVEYPAQLGKPVPSDLPTSPGLQIQNIDERLESTLPVAMTRIERAPALQFPRRTARPLVAPFNLSDITNEQARQAGARFRTETDPILARTALQSDSEERIHQVPQAHEHAQQELSGISTIVDDFVRAVQYAPEVPRTAASRNAAQRIVDAFLEGAGATGDDATMGAQRRGLALDGIRRLIRNVYMERPQHVEYDITPVPLAVEPILVTSPLNAWNDSFVKFWDFIGWQRNIMPAARFDANTTEFAFARMIDRDDAVAWWLRLARKDGAYIPRTDRPAYYPDFIVDDRHGTKWVVETKSDDAAENDTDVEDKAVAGREWARAVTDDGSFGIWKYLLVTESEIAASGDSWLALVAGAYIDN